MRAPASAYAALGLEPGADRGAVERAYRDLIKRYHPDRSGGDAARAAEINRAYFEIRGQPEEVRPVQNFTADRVATRTSPRRRSRRHSRLWPLVLAAILILAIVQRGWLAAEVPRWSESLDDVLAPPVPGQRTAVPLNSAALDGPLAEIAIARSIEQAIGMAERGEEQALADRSRACHRRMRSDPDLEQLDRCAAFDDAVAAFGDRDPMSDAGAFSASAITARQMTAASLLSDDFLAIERRLDRIRMVVQLTLRPQQAAEPPVPAQDGEGATDAPHSNEI
jgi:hypothetical protein